MKTVFFNIYSVTAFAHPDAEGAKEHAEGHDGPVAVPRLVPDDFKVSPKGHQYSIREFEAIPEVQVVPVLIEDKVTAADEVTVGDLNSKARGTGARKSAGKPDWSQLPWWVLDGIFQTWKVKKFRDSSGGVFAVINLMAEWQRGRDDALDEAAALLLEVIHAPGGHNLKDPRGNWFPVRAFESTVRVLEFGAKKYVKGNWARGMAWSVCFTCTMSHLSKAFQGEENDEESNLSHLAHAMCNIVFLLGYRDLFPEGDDRLPEFKPGGINGVDKRHD